jgi:hypothetical protein
MHTTTIITAAMGMQNLYFALELGFSNFISKFHANGKVIRMIFCAMSMNLGIFTGKNFPNSAEAQIYLFWEN